MSYASYVLGAWGVTVAAVGAYAAVLVIRGRRLMRQLGEPAEEFSDKPAPANESDEPD